VTYEDSPSYGKYMSNSRPVLEGLFNDHNIRFTQPAALNDPMDCQPLVRVDCPEGQHTRYIVDGVHMPSANDWYSLQLVESRVNESGILSLTKNPVSFDMWSKYANGHKGFLIELRSDFNKHKSLCSDVGISYSVSPVNYVATFEIQLTECQDATGEILYEEFDRRFFYTKLSRWASEKEYRLVRPLRDLGKLSQGIHIGVYRDTETVYLSPMPLELIVSVTFGAYMPRETKEWIIQKCAGTDIQFLQAVLYPRELDDLGLAPRVELVALDDPVLRTKILKMQPQLLLKFDSELLTGKVVSRSRLADLPYYSFNTEFIHGTYDRLKRRNKEEQHNE
jgi:hypothetical protein